MAMRTAATAYRHRIVLGGDDGRGTYPGNEGSHADKPFVTPDPLAH
jgi:hypothetical protein